jgi:hypothetical protein
MIRRTVFQLLIALAACLLHASGAAAQSLDAAGGYAYLHESDLSVPSGWFASGGGNINSWFGFVGQVSGHYKTIAISDLDVSTKLYVFGGGPRISVRQNRKLTWFVQAVFGAASTSAQVKGSSVTQPTTTNFARHYAAGADIRLVDPAGMRVQVGETFINAASETQAEFHVMVGILFRTWP